MVFSRFVVGMRAVLAIVAGICRYPTGRMVVYSAVSYILFVSLIMYLAIKLVENLHLVEYYFRMYNYIVWPIVIVLLLLYLIRKIYLRRAREQ